MSTVRPVLNDDCTLKPRELREHTALHHLRGVAAIRSAISGITAA